MKKYITPLKQKLGKKKLRNTSIIGIIVISIFFIQIGYAVLESSLNISGEAVMRVPLKKLLYAPFDSLGQANPPRMLLYASMDEIGQADPYRMLLYAPMNGTGDVTGNKEPLKEEISESYFDIIGSPTIEGREEQSKFGGSSLYFPGTITQRVNIKNEYLNFGYNDFTISFWINPEYNNTSVLPPASTVFSTDNQVQENNLRMYLSDGNYGHQLSLWSGVNFIIGTNVSAPFGEWSHCAVVRKSGVFSLYLNGKKIGENSIAKTLMINLHDLSIGGGNGNDAGITTQTHNISYKGYMDDFVIYNYAKYDGDFTPPDVEASKDPLNREGRKLAIKDTISDKEFEVLGNAQVVGTSEQKKFGNASLYFPGTEMQRIHIENKDLNFGLSDFTISFWLYPEIQNTYISHYAPVIFSTDNPYQENNLFLILFNKAYYDSKISLWNFDNSIHLETNIEYKPLEWKHYAVVRKDGVFTVYQDGIKIGESDQYKNHLIDLSDFSIGGANWEANAYKGYMDDFAIYNYAKYDGNFTPPTVDAFKDPLNKEGVQLVIKDTVSDKKFEVLGGAQVVGTNEQKKFGNASLYFPGTEMQRIHIENKDLNFGLSDFTISFWLYPEVKDTEVAHSAPLIFGTENLDQKNNFLLFLYNLVLNTKISLWNYDSSLYLDTNIEYTPSEWKHYAIVRKDGVFIVYQDGIKIGESDQLKNYLIDISDFTIGGSNYTGTAYKGYMDDFAIYNKAIYDGNFTPPNNPAGK